MTESIPVKIGENDFQIVFFNNRVFFWEIAEGNRRNVGNGSFVVAGNAAKFDGSITHRSGKTALDLFTAAEEIFHRKHPDVRIKTGHAMWFRSGKKPVPLTGHQLQRLQAGNGKPKPRRRPR
jgi:hypothetical protein